MRDFLAVCICHLARFFIRLLGRNGGTMPGELALKVSPGILKRLKYPDIYIAVTGTNGKTSTTGMIRTVFENAGYRVVSNIYGDNLIFGAATAILAATGFDRRVNCDAVVLEFDEMTLGRKFEHLFPTDVVITNFFRDQLDRCGETAAVIEAVSGALADFKGRLFINADDPMLYSFWGGSGSVARKYEIVRYGLSENRYSVSNAGNIEAAEGRFCPVCSHRLSYKFYQYSHIGDYYCEKCGFSRVAPDFIGSLDDIDHLLMDGSDYGVRDGGLYHYYNEVVAIAVALAHGIGYKNIVSGLSEYKTGAGRMEQIGNVLLNLVKNPTGLNQVLRYIRRAEAERCLGEGCDGGVNSSCREGGVSDRALLFVLNDNRVDGTDVSWIWDADIESLGIRKIICSGLRAYDIALRLKYSGEDFDIEVIEDIGAAAKRLKEFGGYALSTYSSLVVTRGHLK